MWTQTHRANVMCTWRQRLGWRLYKPHTTDRQQATRSEERGWSRFSLPVLRGSLLTPWSQTAAFQNGEMIHFYGLNHLACGFCYGNPSKLIFLWIQLLVPHFPTTFLSLDWFEWPKSLWFPGMCLQRHGHGRQRWKADDGLGAGQHGQSPKFQVVLPKNWPSNTQFYCYNTTKTEYQNKGAQSMALHLLCA